MQLTAADLELGDKLTPLQRKTVLNVLSGMKQIDAYKSAGGKAKNDEAASAIVSRMLSNAKVRAFYDALKARAATEAVMTREEALIRLTRSARVTINDIAEFDEKVIGENADGDPIIQTVWRMKGSNELSAHAASAIKSVTAQRGGAKIEMHDPLGAIKQLADMQGWSASKKLELTGKDGAPIAVQADVSSDEVTAAINSMLDRL